MPGSPCRSGTLSSNRPHRVGGLRRRRRDLRGSLVARPPPSTQLALAGATLLLNLSASDEVIGKASYRRDLVRGQSGAAAVRLCLCRRRGGGIHDGSRVLRPQPPRRERHAACGIEAVFHRPRAGGFRPCPHGRRAPPHDHLAGCRPHRGRPRLPSTCRLSRSRCTAPSTPRPSCRKRRAICSPAARRSSACRRPASRRGSRARTPPPPWWAFPAALIPRSRCSCAPARLICWACRAPGFRPSPCMPGFGTTGRTKSNAQKLAELLGASFREVPIGEAVRLHFRGHRPRSRGARRDI